MGAFGILGIELPVKQAELPMALIGIAEDVAGYEGDNVDDAAEAILAVRAEARAKKDWARADAIRDQLKELNLVVEDTAAGSRIKRA